MRLAVAALALLSALFSAPFARADAPRSEARVRFDEGVAAYDAGDYALARAKFLQAYAVGHHPDVLFNLGSTDLRAGRRAEAARWFERYLAEAKDATPERRAEAHRALAEARSGEPTATTTTTAASYDAAPSERSPAPGGIAASALLGVSSLHLNLGAGARGGVTLPSHVWIGGAFVYNVGETVSATAMGYRSEAKTSAWYVGPEAGYEIPLAGFVVRPYAGIGVAVLSASASGPGASASASDSEVVLWPGVVGSYVVPGTKFVVGADFHLLTIPGGPASCLFATGGMYL